MNKDSVFKKRLLKLAKLLRKLPKRRFNYNHWVGSEWQGRADLSCGTTACAFGWATTIPSLRKKGLRLRRSDDGVSTFVTLKQYDTAHEDYTNSVTERAALEIFGLDKDEFEFLFVPESGALSRYGLNSSAPDGDASAKEVAKHIREFVKAKYNRAKAL